MQAPIGESDVIQEESAQEAVDKTRQMDVRQNADMLNSEEADEITYNDPSHQPVNMFELLC